MSSATSGEPLPATSATPTSRAGTLTSSEIPRMKDPQSKDGLIRMLLQNSTPTPPLTAAETMGPPSANLPPIPKWSASPMNPLASPSSVPTTPIMSPKRGALSSTGGTPTSSSATAMISVQAPTTANVSIIAVDVTTDDQGPLFVHQISSAVSSSRHHF